MFACNSHFSLPHTTKPGQVLIKFWVIGTNISVSNRNNFRFSFQHFPVLTNQKKVIPGYADAHTPAKEEVPVKLAYSQLAEIEGKAHAMISRL